MLGTREMIAALIARDQASAVMNKVGDATEAMGRRAGLAGYQLFAMGLILNKVGGSLERAGKAMLDFTKESFEMANEFSRGMALVQTQAQTSAKNLNMLGDAAQKAATVTGRSTEELAEGLFDIFSSIEVGARKGANMMTFFAKAATAGGTDVRTVTRGVIQILNAFDMQAGDTRYVLDLLFQQLRKSTGTFEEVVAAWGNIVGAGRMANQTLETLAGSVNFLTIRGRTQAQATISVSRALDQLTRATNAKNLREVLGVDVFDEATGKYKQLNQIIQEMSEAMKGMTLKEQAAAFYDIFGAGQIQANRFFRLAIPGFKDLNKAIDQVDPKSVEGQFRKAWKILRETPAVQMERLGRTIDVLKQKFGELVTPFLLQVADAFKAVLDWILKLDPKTQKLIAFLTVLGGVVFLFGGKVMGLVGSLFQLLSLFTFMTGSIGGAIGMFAKFTLLTGGVVLALGALAGAAFLIIKNWDKFKKWWKNHWTTVVAIVTSAVAAIGTLLTVKLVRHFVTAAQAISTGSGKGSIIGAISGVWGWFKKLGFAILGLKSGTMTLGQALGMLITPLGAMAVAAAAVVGSIMAIWKLHKDMVAQDKAYQKFFARQILKGKNNISDMTEEVERQVAALNWWDRNIFSIGERIEGDLDRGIRILKGTWEDWNDALGGTQITLQNFNNLMHEAPNLTKRQQQKLLGMMITLDELGGSLDATKLQWIENLLKSGSFHGVMELLDKLIRNRMSPALKNMSEDEAKVAEKTEVANTRLQRQEYWLRQLDKPTPLGALKNLLTYEERLNEKVHDANQKLSIQIAYLKTLDGRDDGGGPSPPPPPTDPSRPPGTEVDNPRAPQVNITTTGTVQEEAEAVAREVTWALRTSGW